MPREGSSVPCHLSAAQRSRRISYSLIAMVPHAGRYGDRLLQRVNEILRLRCAALRMTTRASGVTLTLLGSQPVDLLSIMTEEEADVPNRQSPDRSHHH